MSRCRYLEQLLENEELDVLLRNPSVAKHVESCHACSSIARTLTEIDRELKRLPAVSPGTDVMERVSDALRDSESSRNHTRAGYTPWLFAAGVVVTTVTVSLGVEALFGTVLFVACSLTALFAFRNGQQSRAAAFEVLALAGLLLRSSPRAPSLLLQETKTFELVFHYLAGTAAIVVMLAAGALVLVTLATGRLGRSGAVASAFLTVLLVPHLIHVPADKHDLQGTRTAVDSADAGEDPSIKGILSRIANQLDQFTKDSQSSARELPAGLNAARSVETAAPRADQYAHPDAPVLAGNATPTPCAIPSAKPVSSHRRQARARSAH
jgi:hypothetical protein